MANPAIPTLRFKSCDLQSITITWKGDPSTAYKLEYRDISKPDWQGCESMDVAASADGRHTVTVDALLPSMTYIFRLWVLSSTKQLLGPSTDIAFDTEGQYITNRPAA
eukprot:15682-Heterococcus_DN1.PRE.2